MATGKIKKTSVPPHTFVLIGIFTIATGISYSKEVAKYIIYDIEFYIIFKLLIHAVILSIGYMLITVPISFIMDKNRRHKSYIKISLMIFGFYLLIHISILFTLMNNPEELEIVMQILVVIGSVFTAEGISRIIRIDIDE